MAAEVETLYVESQEMLDTQRSMNGRGKAFSIALLKAKYGKMNKEDMIRATKTIRALETGEPWDAIEFRIGWAGS
jgi:hypothetical protein